MKKFSITLILFFIFIFTQNYTFAENITTESDNITQETQTIFVDSRIQRELKNSIENVYGEDKADVIYEKIMQHAETAIKNRPQNLSQQDLERKSDWFKDEIVYMFYVDQFGVIRKDKNNKFEDTALMLDYLKELGVTTLYLLPFVDSPMEDSGFDVKNPRDVRDDLGGMEQFENFIKTAKEKGFKIKSDLV